MTHGTREQELKLYLWRFYEEIKRTRSILRS